jgi:hypothetical protein
VKLIHVLVVSNEELINIAYNESSTIIECQSYCTPKNPHTPHPLLYNKLVALAVLQREQTQSVLYTVIRT